MRVASESGECWCEVREEGGTVLYSTVGRVGRGDCSGAQGDGAAGWALGERLGEILIGRTDSSLLTTYLRLAALRRLSPASLVLCRFVSGARVEVGGWLHPADALN